MLQYLLMSIFTTIITKVALQRFHIINDIIYYEL